MGRPFELVRAGDIVAAMSRSTRGAFRLIARSSLQHTCEPWEGSAYDMLDRDGRDDKDVWSESLDEQMILVS